MASKLDKQRPQLKNLDDMFHLKDGQISIELDKLIPFAEHPFHLYDGERLDDMVNSVKENGVLIPIIVRETGDNYEILAGHNRVNASRIVGLTTIPAIVKNVSDEEAWIYVVETNLIQRSFADMSHSEKAAVINVRYSKMFSQGKRNDILSELKSLENPHEIKENETCEQVEHKLKTRDKVAKEYSLSKDKVARYLRIHKLIPELKTMLDMDAIAFIPAVTISFLGELEQMKLVKCIELNGFSVDMKKADVLREYSGKGKLTDEKIYLILNGELGQKPKPNRTPVVKIKKDTYSKYFNANQPAKEVEEIVEKALELYFKNLN